MRDPQLDPSLLAVERLVGRHLESELLGVELERPSLVARRDTDELDVRDHRSPPGCRPARIITGAGMRQDFLPRRAHRRGPRRATNFGTLGQSWAVAGTRLPPRA